MREIIDALIARRKELGLTQSEVAERMGVEQPTISGFETEGSDPRLSTIRRYAAALGVSYHHTITQVMTYRDDPEFQENVALHGIRSALVQHAYRKHGVVFGSPRLPLEKIETIVEILEEQDESDR